MSEIKVNKLTPRTNCGTVTLGDSGDTFTIPAGATISNLGTATGFGGTGVVSWETGSIKTTGFTAVSGTGYFCNTTAAGFTVTLPASPSAGDVVGVADYAQTFDSDNLTLGRNSENIGGSGEDATLNTKGLAVTLVYVDSTKGWLVTDSGVQSDAPGTLFVAATGGCSINTCGNYKIHTFNNPGTFTVTCAGNGGGSNTVSYLMVAGGGGGGRSYAGGGGAGGFRESKASTDSYTASPLNATTGPAYNISVASTSYPVVVGAGGAGSTTNNTVGTQGCSSSAFCVTSAGGGAGGAHAPAAPNWNGGPGGSGGGGGSTQPPAGAGPGGSGNSPSTVPPQGQDGGDGYHDAAAFAIGAGGGGAGAAAVNVGTSAPSVAASPGGAGVATEISTSSVTYAGGGGGGGHPSFPASSGTGGAGGGGAGGVFSGGAGTAGTANLGGGGGGGSSDNSGGRTGGSGIVIIRYKYQ